tara:strand:- start:280 stop:2538 length:2259 start_codon:yes stop_codon:yes gene_type:complete
MSGIASVVREKLRAFHGSPYSFDRFSTDQIGTGEGAQAYGRGLYFAEREATAESYRDSLTQRDFEYESYLVDENRKAMENDEYLRAEMLERAMMHDKPADFRDLAKDTDYDEDYRQAAADMADEIAGFRKEDGSSVNFGSMYEVEIDASVDELLDYDLPLKEQSPQVQKAIDDLMVLNGVESYSPEGTKVYLNTGVTGDSRGHEILHHFTGTRGQEGAPEALKFAGIKGVKYADAQTRFSKGKKTNNFVIFDDRLINIAKKYGFNADALGNVGLYGGATALMAAGLSPEDAQASVEAAQTKSARGDIGNPVDRLMQPVDPRLGPISQIVPEEEGYRDAAERRLAYLLGDDRQDFRTAEKVFGALDFVPGIGDVQAGVDVRDAAVRGDYLESGVNALGLLPLAGGALAKGGKELIEYLKLPTVDREMSLMQRVGDPDSVNNMNVEYEAGPQIMDLPMLRADDILNRPYVSTMADTSRGRGERVTNVDGVEIDATMLGGQDHMLRPENIERGELWAAEKGAANSILNAARQASDLPGAEGTPILAPYGMAGHSPDFATFSGDVSLGYAQAVMSKRAKKALDKRIREGAGKIAGLPDWPGIDSPEAPQWMLQAGGKRKDVLKALDEFRGDGALNASQTRAIVTDPRQLNPEVGALMNVGEIDLNRATFPSMHTTYNTAVAGQPKGRLGFGFNILNAKPLNRQGVDFVDLMTRNGHNLQANKLPAPVGKAMQGGGLIGVFDEEIVEGMLAEGIVRP